MHIFKKYGEYAGIVLMHFQLRLVHIYSVMHLVVYHTRVVNVIHWKIKTQSAYSKRACRE